MSGTEIMRATLLSGQTLLALVPGDRIKTGDLPEGIALPAIALTEVSWTPRRPLKAGPSRHVAERVQVTVHAQDYPQLKAVQRAVLAAADAIFPEIEGFLRVTVHADSSGPAFKNPLTNVHIGSHDFRVTYSEQR
jgi:hypothetical protein